MKKIISLLLVCATMLTMGIFSVSAQWGNYGDFENFIENGEVEITTLSENVSGKITIPNKINGYPVTSVDCMVNMRAITSIEVQSDNPYFASKDGVLYSKDMKKLILVPSGKNVTSFTVPDGVTSIDGAFAFCTSLKEITIPASVTDMEYFTFAECYELKDVYYGGTKSQWEEIMGEYDPDGIPAFDDYIFRATVHYNSKGNANSNSTKPSTTTTSKSGWQKVDNAWYYYNANGESVKGWVKDGNVWYYMNSSGAMATGWVKDGNAWYYMKSSGAMATGWVKDGNAWYYMKSSGAMATGWVKDGNAWYYMNSNGAMRTAPLTENGKTYYFNSNGAMK